MSIFPKYQARIRRALRNNLPTQSVWETFGKFRWFSIFLIVVFPLYPTIVAMGQASETQVGEYDETSILHSYQEVDASDFAESRVSDGGMVSIGVDVVDGGKPQPIQPVLPSTEQRESIETHGYIVKKHDDIAKIAKRENIDANVILWANHMSIEDTLIEGQTLRIPNQNGLIHVLQSGETISGLAYKYDTTLNAIVQANEIADTTRVRDGRRLFVPGGVLPTEKPKDEKPVEKSKKEVPSKKPAAKPAPPPPPPKAKITTPEKANNTSISSLAKSHGLKDSYKIEFTGKGRGFVKGNCTWYVARNKTVTWRGNANRWIRNARAAGVKTGSIPVPGAIIQFSGRGYNSYYGHVGIVVKVQDDHIVVRDMNYRGLYEVTERRVDINDSAIDGYIYVD